MADDTDLGRVLVVVPTYDEAPNLARLVARVRRATPAVDVLIVDDASPDGTGDIADSLADHDEQIYVRHRAGKDGLGPAYRDGFTWARSRGYDVVVEMDADGSHSPEELPRLLEALRTADVVLGARWVPGGTVQNWPATRMLLSRGGNTYVRLMLGMPLKDATAGYRAIRLTALDSLDIDTVASAGYCFQVDVAWRAVQTGLRVVEVPITFVERTEGVSKMSRAVVTEALIEVTRWGLQRRTRQVIDRLSGRLRRGSGPRRETVLREEVD